MIEKENTLPLCASAPPPKKKEKKKKKKEKGRPIGEGYYKSSHAKLEERLRSFLWNFEDK